MKNKFRPDTMKFGFKGRHWRRLDGGNPQASLAGKCPPWEQLRAELYLSTITSFWNELRNATTQIVDKILQPTKSESNLAAINTSE